jgi:hypothetical protein
MSPIARKLMIMVAERISDGSMLHLIRMWLKAPVMEEDEDGTKRYIGGGKGDRKGTPQGGVISPPGFVREAWTSQRAGYSGLEAGACLAVKNIGKPCARLFIRRRPQNRTHGLMREG